MTLAFTYIHEVSLQTFLGATSYGRTFADAATVACYIQDAVLLVRSGTGDEVTSTAKLNAPLAAAPTTPPVGGQFTPGSEVTTPSGRKTRVITARRHDSGPLLLGLDHVEVFLE